jgi:Arc/MetJ family transcription regulator
MKRTNLVLDEQVLEEARRESGLKTYSDVVNLALKEFVRRKSFARIDEFGSTGVWEGSLEEMREDKKHVSR